MATKQTPPRRTSAVLSAWAAVVAAASSLAPVGATALIHSDAARDRAQVSNLGSDPISEVIFPIGQKDKY